MKRSPLSLKISAFAGMGALLAGGAGWLAYGQEDEAGKGGKANNSRTREAKRPEAEEEDEIDDAAVVNPEEQSASAPPVEEKTRRGGISLPARERLDMMLPPGRTHTGVRFPEYLTVAPDPQNLDPETGAPAAVVAPLTSLFETKVMTRLDADHLWMDGAKWEQFDAETGGGEPVMKVELQSGIYNLKNGILATNHPARIENETLRIDGNAMLHDRATGLTRLTGDVQLRFFEMVKTGKAPAAGAAPAKSEPAAAPNPEN